LKELRTAEWDSAIFSSGKIMHSLKMGMNLCDAQATERVAL